MTLVPSSPIMHVVLALHVRIDFKPQLELLYFINAFGFEQVETVAISTRCQIQVLHVMCL